MFRKHFNSSTLIAIVALVFAMTGGAFALANKNGASPAASTAASKSKSKTKMLRGPRGPKGATGTAGAAGPAGLAGPQGPAGANGKDGTPGPEGKTGPTGPTGPTGAKGATGATGATGTQGEPWTAGGTLPVGKTETGTWAFPQVGYEGGAMAVPISFSIPLPKTSEHVEYLTLAETSASVGSGKCEYEASNPQAVPVAPRGYLCVFTLFEKETDGKVTVIASPSTRLSGDIVTGALVEGTPHGSKTPEELGLCNLDGVWAVTAG